MSSDAPPPPSDVPTPGQLRARATMINALSASLDNGASGLASVPGLLRQVLQDQAWRHFTTMRDEDVRHDSFSAFITTPPLKGLGASEELIRRLVADDIALLDLLDRQLARPAGRPTGRALPLDAPPAPPSQNDHGQEIVDNIHNSDIPDARPDGTSRTAGLRKLRKHAPHLLPQVTAGQMSVNKALIEAGLRERTVTVPVSAPEKAAQALRRHLPPDQLARLAKLLSAPERPD